MSKIMKLNEIIYVAVDEDGDIIGDGEGFIISPDRELAEMDLAIADKAFDCKGKIVEVRIVETRP